MPFQRILQEILTLEGVEAVVFLDAEGETVLSFGIHDQEKLKLLGAYQSILLKSKLGKCRTIFSIFDHRTVLTHHMKDGYFLSVLFGPEVLAPYAHFRLQHYYDQIEKEL